VGGRHEDVEDAKETGNVRTRTGESDAVGETRFPDLPADLLGHVAVATDEERGARADARLALATAGR